MVNYQWDWCPWIEASQHRGIQSTTVIINIIIIIIIIIIIVMIITGKRSTKEEDEWIMGVCTQLICLLWSYSLCVCLFVPIWTSPSGVPLRRTPPAASRQRRMTSSPFQWRHPSCNKMTPPPPPPLHPLFIDADGIMWNDIFLWRMLLGTGPDSLTFR